MHPISNDRRAPMSSGECYAVFDTDVAKPPTGLEHLFYEKVHFRGHNPLERRRSVDDAFGRHQARKGKRVDLDAGGMVYDNSPFCHYAEDGGVSAMLSGEVSHWPGIDAVSSQHDAWVRGDMAHSEAHWLLDFYSAFAGAPTGQDRTESCLTALGRIQGHFAFVIYDGLRRRVMAARDAEGRQPLFWGATEDGRFMFGTTYDDLVDCNPTATAFPAGALYASERSLAAINPGDRGFVIPGQAWPGRVLSFLPGRDERHPWRAVKAIPRVTSRGVMNGCVFRVASEVNVGNLGAGARSSMGSAMHPSVVDVAG